MSELLLDKQRERPEPPIGVVRPTIDPNATMPMFEACCRLCDSVSLPGIYDEIVKWLTGHLRSKHGREIEGVRQVKSGTEDWPLEVKR